METVLITGGTGLVGQHLTHVLMNAGYQVMIATRRQPISPSPTGSAVQYVQWDPSRHYIDSIKIGSVDHIVNLAGAGVADKRWTKKRKDEIVQSRVDSGRTIVKALTEQKHHVRTLIQASAIGWYGPDHDPVQPFDETAPMDHAYLGTTCGAWENSVAEIPSLGIRLATLRIGIVLSKNGGALKEFMNPVRMGIAPVFGSGKQIVSWIHIEDLCNMILFAIRNQAIQGVYNAVAPHSVSQKMLIEHLAQIMRPSFYIKAPVPAFALKILLGEMSIEILKSATVSSQKIQQAGFKFSYKEIRSALISLLEKGAPRNL